MSKWARKVDANQPTIVEELRAMGFKVYPTHRIGQGFPDLLVARGGLLRLIEVKNRKGKLTEDEREFANEWGEYVLIARTAEEVLAWYEQQEAR